MPSDPTRRLRTICLALPEAAEKENWGEPTFRVRDRIFAMRSTGDERVSLWCKAPPGSQAILVGGKGWVGMRLDSEPDWDEVALIVARSYRLVAPKRLATLVG